MYMPTLARFTSRDPMPVRGDAIFGGLPQHAYAYVNNNPVNAIDPSGLEWIEDDNCQTTGCPPIVAPKPIPKLPAGHEKWKCRPGRGTDGRGGYRLDLKEYTVFLNTCCKVDVRVIIAVRRCFEPNYRETGNDVDDAKHFYTEVVVRTSITPLDPTCPDGSQENRVACRVFPGRYVSRLISEFPKNMNWPPPESDEISDLNGIGQAACDAVKKTPAGTA